MLNPGWNFKSSTDAEGLCARRLSEQLLLSKKMRSPLSDHTLCIWVTTFPARGVIIAKETLNRRSCPLYFLGLLPLSMGVVLSNPVQWAFRFLKHVDVLEEWLPPLCFPPYPSCSILLSLAASNVRLAECQAGPAESQQGLSSTQSAEHRGKWHLLSAAHLFLGLCGVVFSSRSIFQSSKTPAVL